jgi:hypothetical protein
MTRKDYIKFADALKERRRTLNPYSGDQTYYEDVSYNVALDDIADDMCRIFAADNGNFDRSRFLTAAGVQE